MLNLNDCINRLSDFKQKQSKRFGINRIGIFGSVARRDNKDSSDLDVVVDIDQPTMTIMYDLRHELKKLFDCDVDVVRMRRSLRPSLKENIERDAIYV